MRLSAIILTLVAGVSVGVGSALWAAGLVGGGVSFGSNTLDVDGWATDLAIGAKSADPYTRARVARHGLLALAKEEAIYFTRDRDDDGDFLREDCIYELSGVGQDAHWWSITLYDGDSRLPMNNDEALSIDATTVGGDKPWRARIAPTPGDAEHWISSRHAGVFDLTLRLYRAAPNLLENPSVYLSAPRLKRLSCGEDA